MGKRTGIKKRVDSIITTLVMIFVGVQAVHILYNPQPIKNVVSIRCTWLDSRDGKERTSETADPAIIANITKLIARGRFVLPMEEAAAVIVLELTAANGEKEKWVLDAHNTISKWGTSSKFSVRFELERLLRATLPGVQGENVPVAR